MEPRVNSSLGWLPGLLLAGGLLLTSPVFAGQGGVYQALPEVLDPEARFIIYLHGRIIEDEGRHPTHPTWGVYEYQRILEALAADGRVVISEQRRPATDMDVYAGLVVDQVRRLLAAGVAPERVSVVGFSKGGGIAMRASALLQHARVNFVFLAACGSGDFSNWPIEVWGRILSIYETSDDAGRSCAELFAKSHQTGARAEVEVNTGEGHGAFYRPRSEWLTPLLRWVNLDEGLR